MSVTLYRGTAGPGLGNQAAVLNLASQMDPAVRAALAKQGHDAANAEEQGKKDARRLEKVVKKSAIETAVAQAAITMSLNAIPVVGSIVSLAAGQILSHHAKRYQAKLKSYGENKMKELRAYIEGKQQSLNKALSNAYITAYKRAIPLALSFQPLEFTKSEKEEVINAEMFGAAFGGIGIFDKLTGKDAYNKGKREIDAMAARARTQINEVVDPIIAKVKQPGFVSLMTKTIAVATRGNPMFLKLCRQLGAPPPTKYMGDAEPGPGPTGSTNIPQRQVMPLQSGNGMGVPMQGPENQALPTTSDRSDFFSVSDTVSDATKNPNRLRTIGLIGAAAVGAILLLR